ncbi:hypothetical protein BH24ACT22_BH24ACT22_11510 [soil metagenome]
MTCRSTIAPVKLKSRGARGVINMLNVVEPVTYQVPVAALIKSGGGIGPEKLRQPVKRELHARCQILRRRLREMREKQNTKPLSRMST